MNISLRLARPPFLETNTVRALPSFPPLHNRAIWENGGKTFQKKLGRNTREQGERAGRAGVTGAAPCLSDA